MNMLRDMLQPTRRNMLRSMFTSTSALTRFAVNGVEAALALDFIGGEYRTANTSTTFADAFTGTSPKLTYSTAAGSNSTMVNSEGKIVWAPHNLLDYSEDFSDASWTKQGSTTIDSTLITGPDGTLSGRRVLNFDDAAGERLVNLATITNATVTCSLWVKGEGSNIGKVIQLKAKRVGGTFVQTSVLHTLTADWVRIHATFTQDPSNTGARLVLSNPDNGDEASEVLIYGAHLYRSDLGGMHPVPGAVGDFQYYVPTNGSAEYLPRVGHHVYNGSAWVNEGLLIESEARTNLVTYSEASQANWLSYGASTVTDLSEGALGVFPGVSVASGGQTWHASSPASINLTASQVYSLTVWYAAGTSNELYVAMKDVTTAQEVRAKGAIGSLATSGPGGSISILSDEEIGGGVRRLSVTVTPNNSGAHDLILGPNSATSGETVIIYGAQLELGSTPSSYMPTSGGTYTRTAQSLTVPPAQFGWPEPEYIGPELVDNSGFTSGMTGWTVSAGLSATVSSGQVTLTNDTGFTAYSEKISQTVSGLVVGKTYELSLDYVSGTSRVRFVWSAPFTQQYSNNATSLTFVASATSGVVDVFLDGPNLGLNATISNISVREINPLSVSIQMDGRVTYADNSLSEEVKFTQWPGVGNVPYIRNSLSTLGTYTGAMTFRQYDGTTPTTEIETIPGSYTPGINVPFNISSRHGSTFVNGAVDGVALDGKGWEYGDTTPKALPDLSSTNLQIAYDFMGTIGTFRQFAGDIGDTGLVTATNPSTEPTLSLTFDGTGGSFYNLNWSE